LPSPNFAGIAGPTLEVPGEEGQSASIATFAPHIAGIKDDFGDGLGTNG
jgi:hypothetical protein